MTAGELTDEQTEQVEPEQDGGMPASDIDATFVALPRAGIASVELDGETVLLVEGTTRAHWLNQTGTVVWKCLDGSVNVAELSAELAEAFGADPEVVANDVLTLAREIGKAGLLDGVAEEQPQIPQYIPPEGLPVGTEVPAFEAQDPDGKPVTLEDFRGRNLLLVSWSPACGFCRRITADLAELQPDLRARDIELVLLTTGTLEANLEVLAEGELECTLILQDGNAEVFAGIGTPSAYLVDEDGSIASDLSVGALDVPVLARTAAGREEQDGR